MLISVPVSTNSGQTVLKLSCKQWTQADDKKPYMGIDEVKNLVNLREQIYLELYTIGILTRTSQCEFLASMNPDLSHTATSHLYSELFLDTPVVPETP